MGTSHRPHHGVHTSAELHVVAGPLLPMRFVIGAGATVLGRASGCGVRLADPAVEAHHARLMVDRRGAVTLTQLAGRSPLVVDGEPVGQGRSGVLRWFEVGATRVAVGPPPLVPHDAIGVGLAGGEPVTLRSTAGPVGVAMDDRCADHAAMVAAVRTALGGTAVIAAPAGAAALEGCAALIELGVRWRARVTADLAHPLDIVRVHLRQPAARQPADRGSTGRASVYR